jgi:hypothetical protein
VNASCSADPRISGGRRSGFDIHALESARFGWGHG